MSLFDSIFDYSVDPIGSAANNVTGNTGNNITDPLGLFRPGGWGHDLLLGTPSRGSSQATSSSLGTSFNQAQSTNQSLATSQTGSQQTSGQQVAFAPLFAQLFGNASNAAAQAADQVQGLQGQASQLFSGGLSFLQQLLGAGSDESANAQIGALGQNLGNFFNQQLIPGITSEGVSTGTFGGARDAVARSLAAGQVGGQYAQGVAQILANQQGQKINAAQSGLSALPSLYGLASSGAQAGLSPYLTLAQILGGPTVLTQSQGTSFGSSQDIANAISNAIGGSYDTSQGQSTSQQTGQQPGLISQIGGLLKGFL